MVLLATAHHTTCFRFSKCFAIVVVWLGGGGVFAGLDFFLIIISWMFLFNINFRPTDATLEILPLACFYLALCIRHCFPVLSAALM